MDVDKYREKTVALSWTIFASL